MLRDLYCKYSIMGPKALLSLFLVAEWIHYTFGDHITHYKTESVHFWGGL